jgi:hypothetical protein
VAYYRNQQLRQGLSGCVSQQRQQPEILWRYL